MDVLSKTNIHIPLTLFYYLPVLVMVAGTWAGLSLEKVDRHQQRSFNTILIPDTFLWLSSQDVFGCTMYFRPQILLGQIFNSLDSECNEEHVEEFFLGKAKRKRIGFCNRDKLSNEDMWCWNECLCKGLFSCYKKKRTAGSICYFFLTLVHPRTCPPF